MNKALKAAWAALAAAVIAIGTVQGLRFLTRDMIDFSVVYRVGGRILAGLPVYDLADGIMPFKYAPIVAYVLTPLAFLPKVPSAFLFFLLSVAAFAGCFRIAWDWVMPDAAEKRRGWAGWLVLFLGVLSTLRVIMNSLDFGQVQVFLLLGALAAMNMFAAGKWWRGGAMLALLSLAKFVPAILCLPWLLRRQWRPAAATAVCGLLLLAAPALWLGLGGALDWTAQWWDMLQVSTNQSMIERWTNQSLLSALTRLLVPNHYDMNWLDWNLSRVVLITKILLLAGLALIVRQGIRRDDARFPSRKFALALDVSYYLLWMILAFPLAWRYHFTSMLLPNMLILAYLICHARRDYTLWGLFAASFFLTSVVNQELLGSRLFEWFYRYSCLTLAVLLTFAALIRMDARFRPRVPADATGG